MKTRLPVFLLSIAFLLLVASLPTQKAAVIAQSTDPFTEPAPTLSTDQSAISLLAQGRMLPSQGTPTNSLTDVDDAALFGLTDTNSAGSLMAEASNHIAFQSDQLGNFDIFSQQTTSNAANLKVSGPGNDFTPVWSPDGSKLVFASDRDGDFDIYLWHAEGDIQQLTFNYANDIHPAWSPDGQRIIFSSDRDGFYFQIYTVQIDGSELTRIGNVPGNNALYPRFSPDGSQISFMRASILAPVCDWNWDVWVMDSDGGNQVKVTTQLLGDLYPNWSPNGNEIIYARCNLLLATDIYVRNLFTGAEQQLTSSLWSNEWGGVSAPNGQTIAFSGDAGGDVNIYLMSLTDLLPIPFTSTTNSDELGASWSWQEEDALSISGQVVDFMGNPIEDVLLTAGQTAPVQTNEQGSYEFDELQSGLFNVVPGKPGYIFTPAARAVAVPPGSFGQNFTGSDCANADLSLRPLLLVTGWGGSVAQPLSQDEQLKYFIDFDDEDDLYGHLFDYGYAEGCNLFYAKNTSPHLFLEDNGKIIRDTLCDYYPTVKQFNPAWTGSFDIIGHSYGGLRARAFLENEELYDGGASCPDDENHRIFVRNLVTLGTPHGGEIGNLPFAALIGVGALVDQQWPALWEMLPPVRLVQNSLARQPEGTCYYLLSGDGRLQAAVLPTLLLPLYYKWPTVDLLPNDLAVHEFSAHALALLPWRYPATGYLANGDIHGQVPKFIDPFGVLRSFVNPSKTFDDYVWSPLQQSDCQSTALLSEKYPALLETAPSLAELVAAQGEPQLVLGTPMTDIRAGTLVYDETVTGTFEITAAGATEATLYWTKGDVLFSLTTPGGNAVSNQTAGVELLTLDTGFGLMQSYQITNAEVGTWSYSLSANNVSEPVIYRLLVTPSEPVAVNGAVPERIANGSPVVITATVTYAQGSPLLGGEIVAQIHRPDDSLEVVSLLDNGLNQDGVAGDGIFGASYGNTVVGGIYGVQFTATGTYQDSAYERSNTALFTVAPASAALLGQYADRGISDNALGLFEYLELSAQINVVAPGRYLISAELYAGNTFITHAVTEESLLPGTHTVYLHFRGDDIRAAAKNGSFIIQNIMLVEKAAVPLLIEASEAVYSTNYYNAKQFGTPEIIYLPSIRRE